jgi:hypothetical protein
MYFKKLAPVVIWAALFTACTPAHAQLECFAQGNIMLDIGFGAWPFIPQAHFDIGVHDLVSVGAGIGVHIPWFALPILARGAFHPFNLPPLQDKIGIRDRFDAYVGLTAGIAIDPDDHRAPVLPTVAEFIGCRFFLSEVFGFFAEHEWGGPGEDLGRIAGGIALKF